MVALGGASLTISSRLGTTTEFLNAPESTACDELSGECVPWSRTLFAPEANGRNAWGLDSCAFAPAGLSTSIAGSPTDHEERKNSSNLHSTHFASGPTPSRFASTSGPIAAIP